MGNYHFTNPGSKIQRPLVCPQLLTLSSLQVAFHNLLDGEGGVGVVVLVGVVVGHVLAMGVVDAMVGIWFGIKIKNLDKARRPFW